MAQKDKATLLGLAQQIRDEVQPEANSATRVGGVLVDFIDSLLHYLQVKQTTGTSATDLMSQKAVTDAINSIQLSWGNLTGTITDQTDLVNYIDQEIAALVDSSPDALDTLNELAAALGDDPNFATTVTNLLAQKADKDDTIPGGNLVKKKTGGGYEDSGQHTDVFKSVANSATDITSFKTVPTVNLLAGTQILWRSASSGKIEIYTLVSGTDAENLPTVVRPNDYAATTNEKVWKLSLDGASLVDLSGIDLSDINEGERKILLVEKGSAGNPIFGGAVEQLDKLAPQSLLSQLGDNANWGNVTGKSGDFIELTGDNSQGQLGQNSQELYDSEGQYFLCISHILDNPGAATWVRNRNRDTLKIGVSHDDAVIIELEDETNWNTTTNIKIISVRSKVGSWYKSEPEGYLYHCYKETGTPPNQWYWYRSGLPATESMQVLNTGNYTGLVTALAGHDWSTGAYDPSGLAGEKGTQGQEYYDAINRKLYKCLYDESNAKLVWEQIQLITS